jgi:hypothetical protein
MSGAGGCENSDCSGDERDCGNERCDGSGCSKCDMSKRKNNNSRNRYNNANSNNAPNPPPASSGPARRDAG